MDFKRELCKNAHICEQKGLVNAIEGNLSILDRERGLLYITPSRTRKLDLTEADVAVLDFETGEQLGGKRASSEFRLHLAALRARPDCVSVFHAHPTHLTAHAMREEPVRCSDLALFALFGGEVPCLPYGEPGTERIAAGIEAALRGRPACLLGRHGAVSVGETPELAIGWMEALESAARAMAAAACGIMLDEVR